MKFKADLTTEVNIEFPDPKRIEAYYIDGDWKETFYTYTDLEDMVEDLSLTLFLAGTYVQEINGEYKAVKDVEGFPYFVKTEDNGTTVWVSSAEECGEIRATMEDLVVEYVDKEEE